MAPFAVVRALVSEHRWRLAVPPQSLLLEEFEDGAVVFNPASWDTHLVNPAAAYLLQALQQQPVTSAELCQLLSDPDGTDGTDDAEIAAHVDDAMESLVKVGLVAHDRAAEGL